MNQGLSLIQPDNQKNKGLTVPQGEILPDDILSDIDRLPEKFNRLRPFIPFSIEIYRPGIDQRDEGLETEIAEVTRLAYEEAYRDGERAHSPSLFNDHYRNAEKHSHITYLITRANRNCRILRIPQELHGGIIGVTSFFVNHGDLLFEDYRETYQNTISQGIAQRDTPRVVISMMARDPRFKKYMNRLLSPHRIMTAVLITALSCKSAFFLEEQAQPSTQRMMRPGNLGKYWPNSGVIFPPDLYDDTGTWRYEGMALPDIPPTPLLTYFPKQENEGAAWKRVLAVSLKDPVTRIMRSIR